MTQSKLILVLMMLFTAVIVYAQPGAPPATPIDGGLSALLAAGGIYGMKKLRDIKRNQS